jgi:hypothetical protein
MRAAGTAPRRKALVAGRDLRDHGRLRPCGPFRFLPGAAAMPHFGMPRRIVETPVSNKTQVNWRRGFFRVWLLASGAWVMSWVLWLMIYGISRGFRDIHEIFAIPVLLIGPPVALMLFGLVAGWAFRGFMPDENGKEKK